MLKNKAEVAKPFAPAVPVAKRIESNVSDADILADLTKNPEKLIGYSISDTIYPFIIIGYDEQYHFIDTDFRDGYILLFGDGSCGYFETKEIIKEFIDCHKLETKV